MPADALPFTQRARSSERLVIGISVEADGTRATAVLLGIVGQGLTCRGQIIASAASDLPQEVTTDMRRLSADRDIAPGRLARLSRRLAEIETALVSDVAAAAETDQLLAVAVDDPGVWQIEGGIPLSWVGLSDAARLAEATGLNVIDAFSARDLAKGGLGGPIDALAQWILLRDERKTRVLLDLGRTSHVTYLPSAAADVLAMDAGPGMALADRLTTQLTEGKHSFDPGGRLAVQGRQISELSEKLLGAVYFEQALPRWHPHGVSSDWFFDESIRAALEAGRSMNDLLCTATHLVAESIVRTLEERLPRSPPVDEYVLCGGGMKNGLLLRELTRSLADVSCRPIAEMGVAAELLDAASIAVLAHLHLDQVPATHTLITGTAAPRVLGRLTAGTPQNWHRLLNQLASKVPTTMSLRSAV